MCQNATDPDVILTFRTAVERTAPESLTPAEAAFVPYDISR